MALDFVPTDAAFPSQSSPRRTQSLFAKRDQLIKRTMDFAIALVALVVLSPLLLLVGLALSYSLRGNPFFRHRRVGKNCRPFRCFKFQTMVSNSDAVLTEYLAKHPDAAREWDATRKLRNDPRVTKFGRFLRKTSIDEIPQLFNILGGQMSFVGPRPITFDELERYGNSAYSYLTARPGLTGLWQISGRSSLSYEDRVALDMLYLRNRSVKLDIMIMLKTIPAVTNLSHSA